MSMLAEPRRKQKWSVDPRNSAWSKDDSKFGQKMLERMGWSKGEGLGRSGQGATEHIKVRVKNDSYGLGANATYEDKWIAHQDDFNELLAQLNNHHSQNNQPEPQSEENKGFSLEEKSKKATKRVHYMKFTKGKDLSSRTETDLNCIFGKRAKPTKTQEEVSNNNDSQDETIGETKTVTSTLSMQEYFAQRMAQLKKDRGQARSEVPSTDAETNNTPDPSAEPYPISSSSEDLDKPKKKKKKKKSKKAPEEIEETESFSAPIVIEEDEEEQQERAGKKKKKRKIAENDGASNDGASNEDCSSTSGMEQNHEDLTVSKKKKLKKDKQEKELLNGHETTEGQTVEAEVVDKKKKKKKKQQHGEEVKEDLVKEDKEGTSDKKSKKNKKRKHQE